MRAILTLTSMLFVGSSAQVGRFILVSRHSSVVRPLSGATDVRMPDARFLSERFFLGELRERYV